MQKVLTAGQMREVDRLTTEQYGIPSILLMENAAHAVARVIAEKLGGSVKDKSILVLCGKGNNGGDGAALARILASQGAFASVILLGQLEETMGDAHTNFNICKTLHADGREAFRPPLTGSVDSEVEFCQVATPDEFEKLREKQLDQEWDVLVDAVFGTGLSRPIEGWIADAVHALNVTGDLQSIQYGRDRMVVSIDVPSGFDADLGDEIGSHSRADVTVTFTAPKAANILPPASRFNGEVVIAGIGTPQELVDSIDSHVYLSGPADARRWLDRTAFSDASYKNKRGHALMIAGSENYSGAAVLAGNAAMRSGVGLVTIATPHSSKDAVATRVLAEVMVRGVAETARGTIDEMAFDEIADLLEKADAIAIGSGLAQDESTAAFVKKVIENRRRPTIVDADALNLLSPFAVKSDDNAPPLILTPHEGEFMRLLDTDDKAVISDRVRAVREFALKHNVILVLKGERVLIGDPSGKVVVNPTGNPGLGKAGNGDTLTGILAGFAAQAHKMEIDIFETVVAAVYIAGMAGDLAEKKYGKRVMTASDVRECLVEVFGVLGEQM